jgi:hypothetical protein
VKKGALYYNVDNNRKVALDSDQFLQLTTHSSVNGIGGDKSCVF